MRGIIHLKYAIIAIFFTLISCSESSYDKSEDSNINQENQSETPTIYEMMEVAFEGFPKQSEIQPLIEAVMKKYNLEVNDENLQKTASMLVSLRKESKIGVTEMEILKHMYQNGAIDETIQNQAAISFLYLESTK